VAKSSDTTKVTRIKASDNGSGAKKEKRSILKPLKAEKDVSSVKKQIADGDRKVNVFKRIGGYFKGSWEEIKLVRWPDRRATWKMTGALIVFTLAFAILILLLDYAFQQLFKALLSN